MMHATPRVSLQHPMLAALPSGTGHCRQAIRSAWSVRIATAHKAALLRGSRPTQAALDSCQLSSWLPVPCATWVLASSGAALVADSTGLTYNPAGGEDFIKNAAGVAYILLVSVFLYRVLTRRAQRAKEQVTHQASRPDLCTLMWPGLALAGSHIMVDYAAGCTAVPCMVQCVQLRAKLSAGAAQQQAQQREAGPLDAFLGAAQAGLLAAGMYVFSSKMQLVLEDTSMPDAYTARNISITVRTILLGLSWLATFIFAANSIGLSALTVQWLLFPDSVNSEEERREQAAARRAAAEAAGPQLPKVTVSSKSDELMKAFTSAERLGRKDNNSLTTTRTEDGSGDTVSMDARNTS
ncbi:hypothetical protein QJQ45_027553 [Haematococcus lacustris]|nr:hypothetical protein QJQ45_027553 [Haematococcus lacustris]